MNDVLYYKYETYLFVKFVNCKNLSFDHEKDNSSLPKNSIDEKFVKYNALEQQLQLRPMFAPASMMLVGAVVTLGRKSIQNCMQIGASKVLAKVRFFGILLENRSRKMPLCQNS